MMATGDDYRAGTPGLELVGQASVPVILS